MKLREYQEAALITAVYDEKYKVTYPAIGLIGEVGELANKLKKVIRDDNGVLTEDAAKHIILECGDILWYLAVLARDWGYELPTECPQKTVRCRQLVSDTETSAIDCVLRLSKHASLLAKSSVQKQWDFNIQIYYSDCFKCLSCIAEFAGYTMDDVARMNIEKLKNRVKNNTLHGSGDDR